MTNKNISLFSSFFCWTDEATAVFLLSRFSTFIQMNFYKIFFHTNRVLTISNKTKKPINRNLYIY